MNTPPEITPYSTPALRDALCRAVLDTLQTAVPDERDIPPELIDGLLQDYENGLAVAAHTGAEYRGGFGNVDLAALVVTAAVTTITKAFLEEVVAMGFEEFKAWLERHRQEKQRLTKQLDSLLETKYPAVSRQVRSRKARRKEKAIKRALRRALLRMLDLLE